MEADTAMLCAHGVWTEAWKTLAVSRWTKAHDLRPLTCVGGSFL